MITLKKLFFLLLLLLLTSNAQAQYQLDGEASSLNFISVKKSKIGEVHTFKHLSGGIADNGVAKIRIQLASVSTNIGIRDERLKTMLFETSNFPSAVVSANLNNKKLKAIKVGDVVIMPVVLALDLHGKKKMINVDLRVIGLAHGSLLVSTTQPIVLNAFDYGLHRGLEKLMTIAQLPSISLAVPVTFSLTFRPDY